MVFADGLAMCAALFFGESRWEKPSPRARMHSSTQRCTPGYLLSPPWCGTT
jgi:hypothetical protein